MRISMLVHPALALARITHSSLGQEVASPFFRRSRGPPIVEGIIPKAPKQPVQAKNPQPDMSGSAGG